MKTYLSLIALLLLPFTAFGQDVDQARWYLEQALELLSETEQPIDSFSVVSESPNIFKASWLSNKQGVGDIEYGTGSFQYSYANNVSPIELQSNSVKIGVGRTGTWQFRFVTNDWVSDTLYVSNQINAPPDDISIDFIGWWDTMMEGESFDDYPFANAVKIDADNLAQAINSEAKYVISFLGFRNDDLESDHAIRKRIQGQTNGWDDLDLSKIAVVILDDEPAYGKEIQENVVRVFQEEYPSLSGTFSYSGNYIIAERTLAENLSHVHVNVYPFMEQGYSSFWGHIDSREKFHQAFDKFMERLRSVSPDNVTFTITMQTFAMKFDGDAFEWKRTPPPPEAPVWYAEAMTRHGIKGGLSYMYKTYKNEDLIAKDMPELMENLNEVYEIIQNTNLN